MATLNMGIVAVISAGVLYRVTLELEGDTLEAWAKGPYVQDQHGAVLDLPIGRYKPVVLPDVPEKNSLMLATQDNRHYSAVLGDEPYEARRGWLVFGHDYSLIDNRIFLVGSGDTRANILDLVSNGVIDDVQVYIGIPLEALPLPPQETQEEVTDDDTAND